MVRREVALHRSITNYALYIFFTILIVVAVVIVVNPGNVAKHFLSTFQLWPNPERITELYFTRSDDLPTSFTPTEALPVDFTVHNQEHQTTRYTYEVLQTDATETQQHTLARGTFTLPGGATKAESTAVMPRNIPKQSKISVHLTRVADTDQANKTYSISYWISNKEGNSDE